jgi:integrase
MASVRKRRWRGKSAWVVDYKDQHGKRRLRTFATKKEADDFRITAGHEVRQGVHTADSTSVTVAEAADLWLAHCKAEGLERSTTNQREQHIRLHIGPFLGKQKLSRLTAPMVRAFLNDLRDNGRSEAMRRKVLTNLKTILTHAQEAGLVAHNVARGIRWKADKRQQAEGVEIPTKDELRAIIEGAHNPWRPLLITAIFTGMRASELRGLRWEYVDLKEGVIRVRERVDAWGTFGPPKSKAGRRDIPLAPLVVNTLKAWRVSQQQAWQKRVERSSKKRLPMPQPPAHDLVFPNERGNPQSHSNIWKRGLKPLQESLAFGHQYGLHALRHAAASLFIEQGWTAKRVQSVMGHATIQMTFDQYGHLFQDPDDDRKAMEAIEARLLA